MASRALRDLWPGVRQRAEHLLHFAEMTGFDLLIYCTHRSATEQAQLYRQGRPIGVIQRKMDALEKRWQRPDLAELLHNVGPQYGPRVTNAGPGESLHQYGMAFDGCPLRGGKPVWGTQGDDRKLWEMYGDLGKKAGLAWAGEWRFREFPHLEEPDLEWQDLITLRWL